MRVDTSYVIASTAPIEQTGLPAGPTAAQTAARQAEGMRILRERFHATIGNTLDAFRQLAVQLADVPGTPEVLDALRRELHRVHGTAGSYGFSEASRLAGEAEARAIAWSGDPQLDLADRPAAVRRFVMALEAAFHPPGGIRPLDGDEKVNGWSGRPTLLVVAGQAAWTALAADARAPSFEILELEIEKAQLTTFRDVRPTLIAIPAGQVHMIAEAAAHLGIPVVAMEARPHEQHGDSPTASGAGVMLLDVSESYAGVFDVAERLAARAAASGVTVLVLDDDPSLLAIVEYVLERPAVRIRTILSADLLHGALETYLPSLLISDINMPGATGIELTRMLRADVRYRDLPIILLSSETEAASRDEALRAGANEFVSKPLAVVELQNRVADRLDRHRLERLAAGVHLVTGLPTGPGSARDAIAMFQRLTADDVPCTVAVIRPSDDEVDGDRSLEWMRETVRVARILGDEGCFVGHHDGTALLVVLALGSADASTRLAQLALPPYRAVLESPRWHAGIVERADLQRADFLVARRCAEDAADVARHEGAVVHRWQRDEALTAPDVILVEDDPALSDMLQYALRATGFTYRAFSNGRVALDFLLTARTQGRRPIVLLDIDLPGLDGYSLHEQLSVERAGDFAVVFVTVHGAESDQLRALKGGAIDFVLKPLNLRILMAKMGSWAAATRHGVART